MRKRAMMIAILSLLTLGSCSPKNDPGNKVHDNQGEGDDSNQNGDNNQGKDENPDEGTSSLSKERADYSSLPYVSEVSSRKKEEWNGAKWIWSSKNPSDSYFAFRRKFTLTSLPSKALLSFSADSKLTLWVNGTLCVVDGAAKRGQTVNDSFYSEKDILSLLKIGDNVLCFEVVFFGQSSNSYISSGQGGLLYDLDLGNEHIISDSNTKVNRIQSYRNKSQLKENYPEHPTSSFLAERDIYFDARLSEDFYLENFDDSSWEKATLVGLVGYQPFGDIYKNEIPNFDFGTKVISMTGNEDILGKELTADTTLTFNMSENQQFLPYFELSSEAGKKITFYTNTKTTQGVTSFIDDYVTKEGKQTYTQYYYRTGYKFIMEVPKGVTIEKVGYYTTGYHASKEGSYQGDNERLNTLWTKAYNTLKICMRDNYMDCPERERSPYTGDGANQIAETLYALDEDGISLARQTYLTLLGWVKGDGIIPSRSPSNTTNEIPMQNLAYIITAYDYYLATGDKETMAKVYPIFVNYLKIWNLNDDGSVEYRDGSFQWVDWGSDYDADLMEQGWYYYAITRVLKLGEAVGKLTAEDKTYFETRRNSIKSVFYSKYDTENGFASINDKGERHVVDDRGNALAVLSGLCEEKDYPLMKSVLTKTKNASPYMERFVLEALGKMGYLTEAKERMLSRYQGMIDYEASTLWEAWSSEPIAGTINHGWAGGPLIVMSKYFAGIQPTSAGYKTFEIKPATVSESYHSSVHTPEGTLSYDLTKSDSVTTIVIDSPNDGGTLILDSSYGTSVKVDNNASTLDNGSIAIQKGKHTYTIQ